MAPTPVAPSPDATATTSEASFPAEAAPFPGIGVGGAKTGPAPQPPPTAGGINDQTAPGPDASSLFDSLAGAPLKVASVRLRGLNRTSRSIVERELLNLGSAATVGDVRRALLADWGVLANLGCFSTVELALEECDPVRGKRWREMERVKVGGRSLNLGPTGCVFPCRVLRAAAQRPGTGLALGRVTDTQGCQSHLPPQTLSFQTSSLHLSSPPRATRA